MNRAPRHCGGMSDPDIEKRPANAKADEWAERIAAQRASGMSVRQFCREQGLTEHSFYAWRKRFQEQGPVRFALVERSARRQERTAEAALELLLGDRRAAAHRHGRGGGDPAGRAGHRASMIHLPASVRVYLCLSVPDAVRHGQEL